MKKIFCAVLLLIAINVSAIDMLGVYPTHWWVGMKNPKLQLMLHGEKIGLFTNFSSTNADVKIIKVNKVENKNYVFLDVRLV